LFNQKYNYNLKPNINKYDYRTDWYGNQTFRMLPVVKECPFNEVIYDPTTKVLAIISKEFKEKPNMFPKLNDRGEVVIKKTGTSSTGVEPEYIQERKMMETYYEYYLDKIEDIKDFINAFAINPDHDSLKIIDEVIK
jgi:hypothetical protein